MIYFVEVPYRTTRGEGAAIKIGYTESFETFNVRLVDLQCGNPHELTVVAIVPGGFAEEARLHAKYAEARLQGEWFRSTRQLRREIDKLFREADWHAPVDHREGRSEVVEMAAARRRRA